MLFFAGDRRGLPVAALGAVLFVLLGARAAPASEQFWGFETGKAGWTALNCLARRTDSAAQEGSWSLALSREFPGSASIVRSLSLNISETPRLSYQVFAPESVGATLRTLLFLKNKDGQWYQCERHVPLCPGRWSKVEFDLSSRSLQVRPLGHFRRWDDRTAAETEAVGIKVFSHGKSDGEVLIDAIQLHRPNTGQIGSRDADEEPLAITDFRPSAARVPRFGKFELTFSINRFFANPFDPDLVTVDARFTDPAGRTVTVPAFYYQDFVRVSRATKMKAKGKRGLKTSQLLEDFIPVGGGCWKVRFAPDHAGDYSYVVEVTNRSGIRAEVLTTGPRRFTCVPSSNKGFVRVASDKLHLEFSTDEPFYPIGHNVHSSNDVSDRNCRLLNMTARDDRGTGAYEDIFRKMAAHGENMAEVWMASWSLDIEWAEEWKNYFGLGRYNLHHAWKLDRILSIAEKHGIYLHLVLENHGKVSSFCDPEWRSSPYNEENGGFLSDPKQFFSHPRAREQYKKKLRYIIARWGYATRIMGLELWSEIDLTGSSHGNYNDRQFLRAKVDWLRDITRYIKKIDRGRHLLTVHYSGNFRRVQPAVASIPGIDYISLDAYRGNINIVPVLYATSRELARFHKPVLVTEYGGSAWGAPLTRLEADLHAGIWSAYMTNLTGSPLLWWFMYIDRHNKYPHYRALANFARDEDRRNRGLDMAEPAVTGPTAQAPPVSAIALKNDRSAYVWVYDKRSASEMPAPGNEFEHHGLAVTLKGLRPGGYTVEFWDTYSGKIIRETSKVVEGSAVIHLPSFKNDIALKVKPSSPNVRRNTTQVGRTGPRQTGRGGAGGSADNESG